MDSVDTALWMMGGVLLIIIVPQVLHASFNWKAGSAQEFDGSLQTKHGLNVEDPRLAREGSVTYDILLN